MRTRILRLGLLGLLGIALCYAVWRHPEVAGTSQTLQRSAQTLEALPSPRTISGVIQPHEERQAEVLVDEEEIAVDERERIYLILEDLRQREGELTQRGMFKAAAVVREHTARLAQEDTQAQSMPERVTD